MYLNYLNYLKGGEYKRVDKQLAQYIRNHIVFVTSVVIVGFTLLAVGEYYLYRQTMHLNKMISEGFMQVKANQMIEENQNSDEMENDTVMEDEEMMDDKDAGEMAE